MPSFKNVGQILLAMKHTPKITFYLLGMFVLAQIIGLGVINAYVDPLDPTGFSAMNVAGIVVEPPAVDPQLSFIYIVGAIIFGTVLILLLFKYQQIMIWKVWFFLACLLTLSIAFGAFINSWAAFFLALGIASFRVFRPNLIVHNLAELFTYGGLAAIFVRILNFPSVIGLLLFISLYDMYAVWYSKHMITLAQGQAKTNLFAGLMLPYDQSGSIVKSMPRSLSKSKTVSSKKKSVKKVKRTRTVHSAILGGGDIGFPLFFLGVVLKQYGFWPALLVVPFVTLALGLLFWYAEKGKFYPAMPFVSIGCLAGFRIVYMFL